MNKPFKKAIICFILTVMIGIVTAPSYGSGIINSQEKELVKQVKADSTEILQNKEKIENNTIKSSSNPSTSNETTKAYTNIILYLIYKISGKIID